MGPRTKPWAEKKEPDQMSVIKNQEPEKEIEKEKPVWLKENQQCMVTVIRQKKSFKECVDPVVD